MTKPSKILLSALLFFAGQLPIAAFAQNQFNLDALQTGELLLNISATERIEIDQDTLHIALQYVAMGQDRVALQDEVNSAMSTALKILENSSDVNYSIEQYQVYMVQARTRNSGANINQQIWRAQQSLQLSSLDSDAALDLARELQEETFTMQNMYYSLSTEQYESVSDSLLNAALIKLQARADAAADSLNKRSAQMVEVTVNGNGGGQNFGVYRGASMAMEMSAADSDPISAPVAQPGKTEVSLTVSARALLSP
jgi:predicted secreted protein